MYTCCGCMEAALDFLPDLVFLSVDVLVACAGVAPVVWGCCWSPADAGGCGTVNVPILNPVHFASKATGGTETDAADAVGSLAS